MYVDQDMIISKGARITSTKATSLTTCSILANMDNISVFRWEKNMKKCLLVDSLSDTDILNMVKPTGQLDELMYVCKNSLTP